MKRLLLLTVCATAGLFGQTPTQPVPDCILNFNFQQSAGSTQTSLIYTNYAASGGTGGNTCTAWTLTYAASAVTTSVNVTFQSAIVASGQLTPASFTSYTGTTVTGANPTTRTDSGQATFSNGVIGTPFLRVQVSGLVDTGARVWGVVYGYKAGPPPTGGGSGGSGCPNPCPIAGAATAQADGASNTPQVITASSVASTEPAYPFFFNGSTWDRQFYCNQRASITVATATGARIITGSMGTTIRICHIDFLSDTAATIAIVQGTGSVCGSSTATLAGTYPANSQGLAADYAPTSALRTTTTNVDVCLSFGASVTAGGVVIYAQY